MGIDKGMEGAQATARRILVESALVQQKISAYLFVQWKDFSGRVCSSCGIPQSGRKEFHDIKVCIQI